MLKGLTPKTAAKKLVSEYSCWLSFILLLILALIVNPNFLRWSNVSNIFVQSCITGLIALGMSMIISTGQIDISVGAQVAIISGLGIEVLNKTNNILIMLLFCLGFGLVIGCINGLLVAKGRMPAMIATLAMQSACRSIINQLGQGGPFSVNSENYDAFRKVAAGGIQLGDFKIPTLMIVFIVFSILFHIVMTRTRFGKHIYAVGSNETSARLAGINVDRVKIAVFAVTGFMCGLTAWLYASRVMSVAAASTGNLYEMDAIAAVAIGGTAMSGGKGKIIGTFLGVLMFKMINNMLTMANVPTFLNGAISGAIIVIAVLLQNYQAIRNNGKLG